MLKLNYEKKLKDQRAEIEENNEFFQHLHFLDGFNKYCVSIAES